MDYNKVNKLGKGICISSQLKRVVINEYCDLIKVPNIKKSEIICDIINWTGIFRNSMKF